MNRQRRKTWIRRGVRVCLVLGLVLLGVSIASVFVIPIYQQPPGAWKPPPGPVPPGGAYAVPPGTPSAGKIRVRLSAGSLIIANGHLPPAGNYVGMVTLGNMYESGVQAGFGTRPRSAWQVPFERQYLEVVPLQRTGPSATVPDCGAAAGALGSAPVGVQRKTRVGVSGVRV